MLESIDLQSLTEQYLIPWGISFGFAIIIFLGGRLISKWIVRIVKKLLKKSGMDTILINFVSSILSAMLLLVVIIASLNQLGVDTTSLIALIGAAGLAVGLSMQDSLKNFAAGVMLIIFKPFNKGHVFRFYCQSPIFGKAFVLTMGT